MVGWELPPKFPRAFYFGGEFPLTLFIFLSEVAHGYTIINDLECHSDLECQIIVCCNYRRIVIEKKLKSDGKITNLPYESYDYSKVRFYLLSLSQYRDRQ